MSKTEENKSIGRKIDLDFVSRNWMLLVKLDRLGFSPEEAKQIARKIEAGKIILRDLVKK